MEKEKPKKLKTRNSRKVYIPIYSMILILIITVLYLKLTGKSIDSLAMKLVGAFIFASLLATEIHRLYNVYEINKNSLIHTMGYFTKRARKMDFSAISDLYVVQTLWQRLLLYGNIEVRLFSGENTTYIKNINNPSEFTDIMLRRINKEMKRK